MINANETREVAEATAAILLGALAPDYMRLSGRPTVRIDPRCPTAYTDGRNVITLPAGFLGHPVVDDVAVAITAHEIGHWFQDLKAVDNWLSGRPQTAHPAANIMLDIALEARIATVIPSLERSLRGLAAIVKVHSAVNPVSIPADADAGAKMLSALFAGRFADWPAGKSGNAKIDELIKLARSMASMNLLDEATIVRAFDNAAKIAPELFCNADQNAAKNGSQKGGQNGGQKGQKNAAQNGQQNAAQNGQQDGQQDGQQNDDQDSAQNGDANSGSTDELIDQIEAVSSARGNLSGSQQDAIERAANEANVTISKNNGVADSLVAFADKPAKSSTLSIASKLQPQFIRPRIRADVVGPGRIDRRALARGEMFHKTTIDVKGGSSNAQNVVICLDCSGSMSWGEHSRWGIAAEATEALSIAIRRADEANHVAIMTFDDGLIRQQRPSSNGILHERPRGLGTTFTWLPRIWAEFPNHTVIVVTDGHGDLPECTIKPSDRARTAVLGIKCDVGHMKPVADRCKAIANLDELPAAMSALVPRGVYA